MFSWGLYNTSSARMGLNISTFFSQFASIGTIGFARFGIFNLRQNAKFVSNVGISFAGGLGKFHKYLMENNSNYNLRQQQLSSPELADTVMKNTSLGMSRWTYYQRKVNGFNDTYCKSRPFNLNRCV